MEGELDASLFAIAEGLGMSVPQLMSSMSLRELAEWRAFYVYRNAQYELEAKALK